MFTIFFPAKCEYYVYLTVGMGFCIGKTTGALTKRYTLIRLVCTTNTHKYTANHSFIPFQVLFVSVVIALSNLAYIILFPYENQMEN